MNISVKGKGRAFAPDTYPKIMCFQEKHGNRYFICNSLEDVFQVSLKVLTSRLADGYWYDEPEGEPTHPPYMLEQAEALLGSARDAALKELKGYQQACKEWLEESLEWHNIQEAVSNKDGKLALCCLYQRKDYEYEGYEFETPEKI